jgi:hypothetical protein
VSVLPFQPPAVVPPPSAEEHARAETERKRQLFEWADRVLHDLGLAKTVSEANSLDELRKIVFDADAIEVALAIREALHPAAGAKATCFAGIRDGALKQLLKRRFAELKKEREKALRNPGAGAGTYPPDWTDGLVLDAKGGVRPILKNLILYLHRHPKWEGVLGYDEFAGRVIVRKRPPFGDVAADCPWTDHYESLTRAWFQGEDIFASQGDIGKAVQSAAKFNSHHPVRAFFDGLSWDGKPRIERWLVTYFHADDTEYARAIGPRFLISAVARIHEPGCKVDHMIILEGPQGRQKSTALAALADPWFTDRISHVSSKDASIETAGVLIIEVPEMHELIKAAASASKSFLTRQHDRFRPPYAKHTIKQPRQCVFAGTINPPVGGYVRDPTGARRYLPVACHGIIDREGIARDRDQLWAEAVVRYKAGAPWWLETPELEALAAAEQAARFVRDPWHETVAAWLGKKTDVSVHEVLIGALKYDAEDTKNWPQSAQSRISRILTNMGFTYCRPRGSRGRDGSDRGPRYRREQD